jgi:carboxylate-amine ligase
LRLFQGYGIELEYMLVESGSLDVLAVADEVLRAKAGGKEGRRRRGYVNEVADGPAGWSNEFVLHVIELKNNTPVPSLRGLARMFQGEVNKINRYLEARGGRLMPTGMHPWMDPGREARLWPHRYRKIYETYDRIFGCRSHGWANIQSIHLNVSFRGDAEFGRLHAAARLLLPIIPALAASSPVAGGKVTGLMDTRLAFYRENQRLVPSITGSIIPEPVYTRRQYRETVLDRMYRDIAPHDPEGTLAHEWLNSRGAVPRFQRSAMEIRLADAQECPAADVAVSAAITASLKCLASGRWLPYEEQEAWPVEPLAGLVGETIRLADKAPIRDRAYLGAFGFPEKSATAGELWMYLAEEALITEKGLDKNIKDALSVILRHGPLSRRILKALGKARSRTRLREVYGALCDCLSEGRPFVP